MPGLYNQNGAIQVNVESIPTHFRSSGNSVQNPYDFLNLTSNARTQALQDQFVVIEEILKKQLRYDQFEDFYSPQ